MIASGKQPQKAEVQKLIADGYDFHCSRTFILTLAEKHVHAARAFIGKLVEQKWITYAADSRGDVSKLMERGGCATSIGFTYRGLKRLGLSGRRLEILQDKTKAFVEGAFHRASHRLADTGRSAAVLWDDLFKPDAAHVFLTIHGDSVNDLDRCQEALQALSVDAFVPADLDERCIEGSHLELTEQARKKRRVHFDFLDGISKTAIKELSTQSKTQGTVEHEPGEFLLGYRNDHGFNPWLLAADKPDIAEFFRNGSFGAFRQMEQDQIAFDEYLTTWSHKLEIDKSYLKAKFCGRWDDGSVVKPGKLPAPADPNDFDFSDDPDGEGCPFGAHIRRMNPRKDPVVPFRSRPLIRRSMPYGPRFEKLPNEKRGLLGLFFCASLEDQFEHLLAEWGDSNPMGPNNRGNAKDPLIGNHEDPDAVFDIPVPGEIPCQLNGFKPFVTTRGTLYAFFPSRKALGMIARLGEAGQ